MGKEKIIQLNGVSKRYIMGSGEIHALSSINLSVFQGDFLAVMGPSGSGKSTLMNIIGLLDRPDEGQYFLKDQEVGALSDDNRSHIRNRTIGFIFQNFNLLPRATALRNVMLPLTYRSMPDGNRLESAGRALEAVGLSDRSNHLPSQLSGGECQRVAIARALVGDPTVILADEPTGNLDSRTGRDIIMLLAELSQRGQSVILVTHDPKLADRADRVIQMLDGTIVEHND